MRVFVLCDHALAAEALAGLLAGMDAVEVVGTGAATGAAAVLSATAPDVVLIDADVDPRVVPIGDLLRTRPALTLVRVAVTSFAPSPAAGAGGPIRTWPELTRALGVCLDRVEPPKREMSPA